MLQQNTAVITISVHKPNLSEDEFDSLMQCIKVLGSYDIVFVIPEKLDTSLYKSIFEKNQKTFKFVEFPREYFVNYRNYNKLCLTKNFYQKFAEYEYMLIYHLDSWVFKDELEYWCSQGFDYLGAPLNLACMNKLGIHVKQAGNGGFSLRKISSMITLLSNDLVNKNVNFYKGIKDVYQIKRKNSVLKNILRIPAYMYYYVFQKFIHWQFMFNEDLIIAYYAPIYMKNFKIAPDEVAKRFAMEWNVENFYKENDFSLPFGAHNPNNYKYLIYKEYIKRGEN